MAKTNQIKKLVNGEIADADDVNQIVENAGSEGGVIPYDATSHERDTNGDESLGSVTYPWGDLCINQNAYLREVESSNQSESASVQIKNLRKFIYLKDCPSSFSGDGEKFVAVNSAEDALEFVTSPVKSNVLFSHSLMASIASGGNTGVYLGTSLTPSPAAQSYAFWYNTTNTYNTVIVDKFKKLAGVSTVTVYAKIWQDYGGGGGEGSANVKVDIGGQSNNVSGTLNRRTPEWVNFDIDVSSLSDGTVYDVTIQLKHTGNYSAFLESIKGFGS